MNTVESSSNNGDSDNKLTSKGGFTEMKKLFFIGLAFVLALTIGAGAAFATPDSTPNLLVTKMVTLVENGLNCTIISMNNITNNGDMIVNATITDTLYYQIGGEWVTLGEPQERNGCEIEPGNSADVEFVFEEIVIPEEARVLKNKVLVTVEGSKKEFHAIWTLEFDTDETEEPVDNDSKDDPVGDTVSAVKSEVQSGNSHCYHFSYANGASGKLNCQIKDGKLIKGVFNGKGLEAGETYKLSLGGVELWSGEATNKAGKVHININEEYEIPDGLNVDSLTLELC